MIVLHNQTGNEAFADKALDAARASSVPDLFSYQFANGSVKNFPFMDSVRMSPAIRNQYLDQQLVAVSILFLLHA